MPRNYSLVDMPAPSAVNPMGALGDMLQIASAAQGLRHNRAEAERAERQAASEQVIGGALSKHRGKLPDAITDLEQGGYWGEANTLRTKAAEIQKAQQEELAERMKAAREGFETSTRYLQGIEAAPEPEKAAMWTAVRPRIVEALPGLAQYVPEQFDPNFVASAIPFGLSASDVAKRRSDAIDALNQQFAQAGEKLDRDKAVLEHLSPWLETADTGEDVSEILDTAESLYGASPAVRARVGEVPAGPLTPEWKQGISARLSGPSETPRSIDAAILAARSAGNTVEVDRLIALKGRLSAASRKPDAPNTPKPISREAKNTALRWYKSQLAQIEKREREDAPDGDTPQDIEARRKFFEATMAEKKRLEQDYHAQIGDAEAVPPAVEAALKEATPGRQYTLSDGSVWIKDKTGAVRKAN